jgi:hypothetical protein
VLADDITYTDSENLLYDGSNIHRNYNGWIRLLARAGHRARHRRSRPFPEDLAARDAQVTY